MKFEQRIAYMLDKPKLTAKETSIAKTLHSKGWLDEEIVFRLNRKKLRL